MALLEVARYLIGVNNQSHVTINTIDTQSMNSELQRFSEATQYLNFTRELFWSSTMVVSISESAHGFYWSDLYQALVIVIGRRA